MAAIDLKSKQQEIRKAAARLFRDKGYSATSMRDLAQAVDLKAPSIYNHFNSKEEILRQICFDNADRFTRAMTAVENMPASSAEKLRALIRIHILIATEDETSVIAFNDEWRHLDEPHLSAFTTIRRDYERRFRAIVEEGIQTGELKPLDPNIVTHTVFSSMRWLYDWYLPGKKITTEDLERDITALLMGGAVR
jgi:TetR/AcrR family transcriptional regulator, cholesterol catabolism regulator